MEIHAPAGKMESVKDYLLHLSMVVLGILIALGLDGIREVRREHALVRHSIMAMRSELTANREIAQRVIAGYEESRATLGKITGLIETELKQRGTNQKPGTDDISYPLQLAMPSLNTGAWQAAVATQALAHMEYTQASVWSEVYARQVQVQRVQDEWIGVLGKLALLNISEDASAEELRQQVAFAKELLQRIEISQTVWRNLLTKYEETLRSSSEG